MNSKKICFILCANKKEYEEECRNYIKNLEVPQGYIVEIISIWQAESMTSGYNRAMLQSDAKYKVYLHQDAFLINRNFLFDMLAVFQDNPQYGIMGVVGTKLLPDNGCMWANHMRTGALRSYVIEEYDDYFDVPLSPKSRGCAPVRALDGVLLATQYDIFWREDVFDGWDFYDISQCFEFQNAGYKVGVFCQDVPWVLHDCGFLKLQKYHLYRQRFLEEYCRKNTDQIKECWERQIELEQRLQNRVMRAYVRKQQVYRLMKEHLYDEAKEFLESYFGENKDDEEFCILMILFKIYGMEKRQEYQTTIFSYWDEQELSCEWLYQHYHKICHYIWRKKYHLSERLQCQGDDYFKMTGVTDIAQKML